MTCICGRAFDDRGSLRKCLLSHMRAVPWNHRLDPGDVSMQSPPLADCYCRCWCGRLFYTDGNTLVDTFVDHVNASLDQHLADYLLWQMADK